MRARVAGRQPPTGGPDEGPSHASESASFATGNRAPHINLSVPRVLTRLPSRFPRRRHISDAMMMDSELNLESGPKLVFDLTIHTEGGQIGYISCYQILYCMSMLR